jgi:hypothetical protein
MQDFIGFIISVAILLLLTYLCFEYVIPFMFIWLFPIITFIILTLYFIRRGRISPLHFDLFIQRRSYLYIVLSAVILPAFHYLILYLIGDVRFLLHIFAFNSTVILLFLLMITRYHLHQRKQYIAGGHHVEELMETCQNRINLLNTVINEIRYDLSRQHEEEFPHEERDTLQKIIDQSDILAGKYGKDSSTLKSITGLFGSESNAENQKKGTGIYNSIRKNILSYESDFMTVIQKAEEICNCDFIDSLQQVPRFLHLDIMKKDPFQN